MCKVIEDFKMNLIEDGKSAKTIESYIGDIKAFIEFLASKGVEFNGILQRFYIQNEEKVSKRNKVIVMLLLYTGVRVSELCSIKIKDIDFLNYSIKIYGKGGKFREVPLKFDLADTIKEYIKDRDYNVKISSKRYRKVL